MCSAHEIEDEIHFLLKCPLYKDERQSVFQDAALVYRQIDALPRTNQFILLMSTEEVLVIHALAAFLTKSMQKRKDTKPKNAK